MKYTDKTAFEKVNIFGTGMPNDMFSKYFTGKSFLNPLTKPGECPVFMANVTFEPGCRNNWHIHHARSGGGQMLLCTAGEGWYQQEGDKPLSLSEGSFVYIPAGVKHWHGAKATSWFSHISLEIPGEEGRNEWLEAVSDDQYNSLPVKESKSTFEYRDKYLTKNEFKKGNMFGMGMYNFMFRKYFSGRSYLKMVTMPGKTPLFLSNVNFEPTCRNNWHVHHDGGQILVCTAGTGWYQEDGKPAKSLKAGDVVYIPTDVNHWHGASRDSWFSHVAISIPANGGKVEWLKPVSDNDYNKL
ncbi:cupin domain-containing protein [Saccharicrinis sp. FJH2]|uniref:cupin domain-containing protein n=1 Tax=Saccharicrinis sp. FJH65 TaxID=3344659 RepID=UPI0035F2ECBA